MASGMLGDSCKPDRLFHRPLKRAFMYVVPSPCSRTRIGGDVSRGKHILPSPLVLRVRILSLQCVREFYLSVTARSKDLMQSLYPFKMLLVFRQPL